MLLRDSNVVRARVVSPVLAQEGQARRVLAVCKTNRVLPIPQGTTSSPGYVADGPVLEIGQFEHGEDMEPV